MFDFKKIIAGAISGFCGAAAGLGLGLSAEMGSEDHGPSAEELRLNALRAIGEYPPQAEEREAGTV